MKKTEIKKEIERVTKTVESFKIEVILWTGDGCYYKEGTKIFNEILITKLNYDVIEHKIILPCDNLELFDNEVNRDILKREQMKVYRYLSKQFKNVSTKEYTC